MSQNYANGFGTIPAQPQHNYFISASFLEFVKHIEGFRPRAELDMLAKPPVLTIGYGATFMVHPGQYMTEQQASDRLLRELEHFGAEVAKMVTVPIDHWQWEALTDFAYNEGLGHLAASTLLKLLNSGDYEGAAKQFDLWDLAGGKVERGLVTRRAVERAWFTQSFVAKTTPEMETETVHDLHPLDTSDLHAFAETQLSHTKAQIQAQSLINSYDANQAVS